MESQNLKKQIQRGFVALAAAACTVMAAPAFAQDVGVVAGLRSDNADGETGTTLESKANFQLGLVGKFEMNGPLQIRSGFLYTQRSYGVRTNGSTLGDFKTTYFEIPVGVLWKFSDYGGVFAGPAISFNLSKECPGSCDGAEVNASPLAIQVGGSFKVAPQFGFELYYEQMTGEIAKGIKNGRSIIANAMITFD